MTIKKVYGTTRFGQVHARRLDAGGEETQAPLVCLHPAPSSGLYFTTAMPLLNEGRQVIAPDYPGYGGSDELVTEPSIADYAQAILELLDNIGIDVPVDILGFHTGCLVAAEVALSRPDSVRRLVLCDVPYFNGEQRRNLHRQMAQPLAISGELDSIAGPWHFNIESRIDTVPLPRAFELFAEHLRAGSKDYFGFAAAFSYDCESRFAALDADVALLATQSALRDPTVTLAEAMERASFVDATEVTTSVFESGAAAISKRINDALAR